MRYKELVVEVLLGWQKSLLDSTQHSPTFNIETFKSKGGASCASTCCACGTIASHPMFNALGLTFSNAHGLPRFKHYRGPEAITKFFELGPDKYEDLFLSKGYRNKGSVTLAQVIEKIKNE